MKIKRNSYASRWYEHWVDLGGTPRRPENFCRFVRVLLIWAPLRWFFSMEDERDSPFFLVLATALGCAILFLLGRTIYQKPWLFLASLGIAIVAIVVISAIGAGVVKIKDVLRESKTIATNYREAKASKLCPYIEIED